MDRDMPFCLPKTFSLDRLLFLKGGCESLFYGDLTPTREVTTCGGQVCSLFLLLLCGIVCLTGCSSVPSQLPVATSHNHTIYRALFYGSSINDWPMFGYN